MRLRDRGYGVHRQPSDRTVIDEGYLVKALARSSSDISLLQSLNVDIIAGDVRDAATLEAGIQGCAYIYHLAALTTRHGAASAHAYRR